MLLIGLRRKLKTWKKKLESEEKNSLPRLRKLKKRQKQIIEKEAKLELKKTTLKKSQMKNFESYPLQPSDIVKNGFIPTNQNHDAQNNVDTASNQGGTCSENAPPVIVKDDLEDCETKAELFACFRKQLGLS